MTLATVSRYDADGVPVVGDRAVVVGGSLGGLLAGRILADGFDEVVVLEKDPLPDEPIARRGVPQANHVHVLLEAGRATLENLFPGYCETIIDSGGLVVDAATELDYFERGGFLTDADESLPLYCASRPLFEQVIRRRVAALDAVTLRPGWTCTDYLADRGARAVTGVEATDGDEERQFDADLVVDATGRTSRTPDWLERHHYPPPAVEEVDVDLAYSTVTVERPPDDRRTVLVVPSPTLVRGGTAVPVEDDRWIVTLFGMHGDHPPTDPEGFREFAASLPTPDLARVLDDHAWVSGEVHHYPFPSNLRRRYEDLHRFPDGLVVTGDALASFNPIYGQGMSVAALEALQLHRALATGALDNLPSRFFDRAAEVVDVIWRMTIGADFDFPGTTGPKPPGTDLFNRYVDRLVRSAHTDARLSTQFQRVLRLERPPTTLLRPEVLWRTLRPTG